MLTSRFPFQAQELHRTTLSASPAKLRCRSRAGAFRRALSLPPSLPPPGRSPVAAVRGAAHSGEPTPACCAQRCRTTMGDRPAGPIARRGARTNKHRALLARCARAIRLVCSSPADRLPIARNAVATMRFLRRAIALISARPGIRAPDSRARERDSQREGE